MSELLVLDLPALQILHQKLSNDLISIFTGRTGESAGLKPNHRGSILTNLSHCILESRRAFFYIVYKRNNYDRNPLIRLRPVESNQDNQRLEFSSGGSGGYGGGGAGERITVALVKNITIFPRSCSYK